MKPAKPIMADSSSQRRAQPVRQTRTNPPRASLLAARPSGSADDLFSRPPGDQPIDIFPAITHFADTVTALPRELVRHFTLLKEVDAKIFTPQEQLFKLVSAATSGEFPESRPAPDGASNAAPASAPMSAQGSSHSHAPNGTPLPGPPDDSTAALGVFDPSNIPKRQLYRQIAFKIQEMLVSLEEKNHVISTANDALQRQLARVNDVWPYLENEFSDEAKWGSTTHWAYPENRSGRSQPEKLRRDGAAAISAAAQALADEAAARSDARKQALQAKRSMKNNQLESDMDDLDKPKKSSKARRATDNDSVGLGISGAANGNPQKRRKTEKGINGGVAMERSISSALSTASKAKTGSPRGTPAPDGAKKRKALPTGGAQAKKKNGLPTKTPSAVSSPVLGLHPDPKARGSPVMTSAPRPTTSRARQNSISEHGKQRPLSSASNQVNGNAAAASDEASTNGASRADGAAKDSAASTKSESVKGENEATETAPVHQPSSRRESRTEDVAPKVETAVQPPIPPTVTTKSGRASKPSTPAIATFQEAALARSTRTRESNGVRKSHKKTNSSARISAQLAEQDNGRIQEDDEEGDIDGDEPTYCYCNSVSYGEMVACDSDDCAREWFHLACVGLKVAPGSKTKWYCEDCKERLKLNGKKTGSR